MGRPWPQPGEPLFTEEDTELALALQEVEDETCRGCGNPIPESHDVRNRDRYRVHVPKCFACEAKEIEIRTRTEGGADHAGRSYIPYLDDD